MLIGSKLKTDLHIILIRWPFSRVVFAADIVKMYKQFFVHPGDADWQRILWRFHPDEPITEYRLLTVTYGTSSAPYLAVRCLLHLVEKHNDTHPNAFEVIRRLRYVDDLFAGADSSQLLLSIKDKLVKLISLAQLHLGK